MSEWISIEKQLPKEGEQVLCSGLDFNKGPTRHYGVLKYNCGDFSFVDEEEGIYDVWEYITHWMPLPEPPK